MKTHAITPAAIDFDTDGPPFSPTFGDLYHPRIGALAQARHVFIAGSRLHERWHSRRLFTILEAGFGLGNNFLATWSAWRQDAAHCERLLYLAIDARPPCLQDLRRAHAASPLPEPELAGALVDAWPPLLPNLHLLPFDQGRVQLMLSFGDVALLLPQIRAHVDAFFLDGYAPSHNPQMWQPRVIKGLARLAAPGATVATWSAASSLRADLVSAGFELHAASGIGGKRDITLGTYAPRYTPRDKPRRAAPAPVVGPPPQAIVIGAGLAGAWAAHALAQRGVTVTVLDRQPQPAAEASGNLAGIFHPTVHGDDGAHAQLLRAAALFAHQRMRPLIAAGLVLGQVDGLLRLVSGTVSGRDALRTMQAQVRALGLPEGYVQALSADQASVLAGVRLSHPAWYFAHAGWVAPAALVRQLLAAPSIRFVGGAQVRRLRRNHDGWAALDANGQVLAQAPVLVLANADGAGSLLTTLGHAPWPLQRWRGQVSVCETHDRGTAAGPSSIKPP